MEKITYHQEGDYLIPDLIIEDCTKDYTIGKYGRMRLKYLKEHKKSLYTELMIKGTLSKHLAEIENVAKERIDLIIMQLAETENVNEVLKNSSQLEWVQSMNNIKYRAEEIVYNEIIYVQEEFKDEYQRS